ncbi:hypothetical protein F5146DRAFT_994519 [Armillaria mellea]|nr:hypothetical protein F5146DRAFT_994519 [Armillaria mellea]
MVYGPSGARKARWPPFSPVAQESVRDRELEGSQPDHKKMRLNSPTDSSSAVLGSNTEVQSGTTAKPHCWGYKTVMLCNDELREQLKSSPGQIPANFPAVLSRWLSHCGSYQPTASFPRRDNHAREESPSGRAIYRTIGPSRFQTSFLAPSESVGRSHHDTANAAPTRHQFHHQQFGHRNQDLYVDAVGQNALPNHTQPASLQQEPFQVPGSMIMMHGTGGSSQSPQFPAAVGSGILDPSSSAAYDEMSGSMSNWSPQVTEGPVPYPPYAFLVNQGSNFVVQAGANESNSTLITSPSREGVDNLMGYDYIGSVHHPFQVFQGSDLFETLSKTTTEDDDDKSLLGEFSE